MNAVHVLNYFCLIYYQQREGYTCIRIHFISNNYKLNNDTNKRNTVSVLKYILNNQTDKLPLIYYVHT